MKLRGLNCYDTVTSTQDLARDYVRDQGYDAAGMLITADYQTGGRGRQGRSWFAPSGANVCMTLIGERVKADVAWQVALVAGIGAAEGIAQEVKLVLPRLRFPNDIYVNGRKLGGILVETVPHRVSGYVVPLVGIGVNVNVAMEQFPEDLRSRVTSLLTLTGTEQEKDALSFLIAQRVCRLWTQWAHGSLEKTVLPSWREWHSVDDRRSFVLDGREVSCRVVDIDGAGVVTLETETGDVRTLHAAQVILGGD